METEGQWRNREENVMSDCKSIKTAPKDGTHIVGYCVHEADPYYIDPPNDAGRATLTAYGASCEGLSHVSDGWHVIEWQGSYSDADDEYGTNAYIVPGWWFRVGSEREEAANPIFWISLPPVAALTVQNDKASPNYESEA
jgi:hypothetical protein